MAKHCYYNLMVRVWERGRSARKLEKPFQSGVRALFLLRFCIAKTLEFHDISYPSLERLGYSKCLFKGANDNSPPF